MDRRTFVGAATAAVCASPNLGSAAGPGATSSEMYEMRTYSLKSDKRPLLDDYLSKAFLPAVARHAAGPVGVFAGPPDGDRLKVTVLVVHRTAETVATLPARLAADADYQKAGAAFLAASATDPAYFRVESSLLAAIPGMPTLARPDPTKPRLLNLRVYESCGERAAAKKVEMFERGELAIFRRVGLTPVFFASTVVGAAMPNLTYMLTFPDEAGRAAAWDRFRADPEWLKLKATPGYADKDIVSKIINLILTPAAYSEI